MKNNEFCSKKSADGNGHQPGRFDQYLLDQVRCVIVKPVLERISPLRSGLQSVTVKDDRCLSITKKVLKGCWRIMKRGDVCGSWAIRPVLRVIRVKTLYPGGIQRDYHRKQGAVRAGFRSRWSVPQSKDQCAVLLLSLS